MSDDKTLEQKEEERLQRSLQKKNAPQTIDEMRKKKEHDLKRKHELEERKKKDDEAKKKRKSKFTDRKMKN
jgi:hypothetical protein